MARIVHVDDLEKIDVAGVHWRPVRRPLGVSAFGVNGYSADAGERLIEEHDEVDGHEELYLVVRGRATFTIAGEEIDARAGTLVFLDDLAEHRGAVATEDGTVAVAVGGRPGAAGPVSAWEFGFAAAPALAAGDPRRAYAIAAEGLADHPDHPALHYNLACYASRAGMRDEALEHLRRAFEAKPEARAWAADDADLDAVRDDPRWPG
jgi:quercetin dioxygenase-like cupin family protein